MYKVGVIGLGQIAYKIDKDHNRKCILRHIKVYQSIDKVIITSVCDINKKVVEDIKNECCIEKGYVSYNLMLEKNSFNIISICSPIQYHFEIIKKCISTGVKAI